jgi:hypothetical protein
MVLHDDHLTEVANLTEEVERLRKVAEQAIFCGGIRLTPNQREIISPTRTATMNADDAPELAQYLLIKETNNG